VTGGHEQEHVDDLFEPLHTLRQRLLHASEPTASTTARTEASS
jgi:hypothetical protein